MNKLAMLMVTFLAFANFLYTQDVLNQDKASVDDARYNEIHTEALSRIMRTANPLVMIVDVRGIETDDGKRIPGAKAIPFDATTGNITANLPDKQAMIIVYCENDKCSTSELMLERLSSMGYKNVWKYLGGIEEWEKNGHKIERGKPAAQAATESGPKSA